MIADLRFAPEFNFQGEGEFRKDLKHVNNYVLHAVCHLLVSRRVTWEGAEGNFPRAADFQGRQIIAKNFNLLSTYNNQL